MKPLFICHLDTLESWQRHILNCSFVNMVRDWREMFYNASARVIKPSIPFGFVQVSP